MTKRFDLTTRDGIKEAMDGIQDKVGFMPIFWLAGKLIDSTSPASVVSKQAAAASEIIREGQRSGV